MSMVWLSWLEICWSVVCWISVFIYVLFLVSQLQRRKTSPFNAPFFVITRYLAVFDLGTIASLYAYRVIDRGYMWFSVPVQYVGQVVIPASILYFSNGEHYAVLLLAINRFTSMCYPLKHKKIWKHILTPALIMNVVWPLFFTVGTTVNGVYNVTQQWNNDNMEMVSKVIPTAPENWLTYIGMWVFTVNGIGCVLYSITVVYLLRKRGESVTNTVKVEIRLTVVGLLLFLMLMLYVVSLMYALHTQTNRFENPDAFALAKVMLSMSSELYAVANPYLLLACSSAVRTAFVDTVRTVTGWPKAVVAGAQ